MDRHLFLIVHNVRSTYNVGSLLRTADGLGIAHIYLTGYTPYPLSRNDARLPHIAQKINRQIAKTALGAEKTMSWSHYSDVESVINELRDESVPVLALEQSKDSIKLPDYRPTESVALLVGREVEGIEPVVLSHCDGTLEIPMLGEKESFNVSQAAAMALFYCRYMQ